ncbi:MAG TPA: hypothetical protein VMU41_12160, partial [Candidatus Binataceae bacterium]|nr:hypothetical protein [Candidatus Binataceae bacterium]
MKAPALDVWWLVLGLAMTGLTAAGCAMHEAGDGAENRSAATAKESYNFQEFLLAGVWQGTSVSDCYGMAPCRGLRHITFTMLPATAGGLNGFYRCEQITASCDI